MKKKSIFTAVFLLISAHCFVVMSADNYKLHAYNDTDADAAKLVSSGVYADALTAQKSIYHNDIASPWKFGNCEASSGKFFIYTDANATWHNSVQWQTKEGNYPLVYDGYTYANTMNYTPTIFFIAPEAAIYKVSTSFNYASGNSETAGSTLFQFKANGGTSVVNMNFGKSFTASNRTVSSDFYVNLHAGDTITFNQAYTTLGDPYCRWTKVQVSGNNNGTAYSITEANASGFYFDNYIVATDFTFLNAKISDAETLIGSAQSGSEIGQYPANAITTFQTAINSAKTFVATQQSATQIEINAQLALLSTAFSVFEASKITTVICTDDAVNPYRLVSGLYLIRLKGTNLYLTAPTAKGTAPENRTTYQTLRDANAQNCQKWSVQFNRNTGFTNPPRYTFVSGVDGTTAWSEDNPGVVGHLDELGYFRDKNTAETQVNAEGTYHNFTVYFDGEAYGLNNVGFNRPLNISATVDGQVVTTNYSVSSPIGFLYDFVTVSDITAVDRADNTALRVYGHENGIRVISGNTMSISIYNLAGINVKNCIINSDQFITLKKGAYIVKSDNFIHKVIVN